MFIGYQINEQGQEFIASIADTRDELENNLFVKYTRIEESNEDWQLINGQYRIGGLTSEELSAQKRSERDTMLKATDVYMLIDFPISDEQRELYKQYRQYLRDLPTIENFPEVEIMSFKEWQQWIGD